MDIRSKVFFGCLLVLMVALQGITIYLGSGLPNVNWPEWGMEAKIARNIFFAFFVGVMGAFAFYLGVYSGFIARRERPKVLEFLIDDLQQTRHGIVFLFIGAGGIVAAVFQAAQPETFAPIQAFVLGATWPSVVTRIMSGEGVRPGYEGNPADTPPEQIPTPTRPAPVREAEVTLP